MEVSVVSIAKNERISVPQSWTLVTGAARSLGAEIAITLAKKGRNILVHYDTSKESAQKVVATCMSYGVQAKAVFGNFTTMDNTQEFVRSVLALDENIDTLINAVGPYNQKNHQETSVEEWTYLFQTNLHTPYALIKAFLPTITKTQGAIINIGTVGLTSARATSMRAGYFTAKMALMTLTKSLARELCSKGVQVNMVSPGYLENSAGLPEELPSIPFGRPATFAEVTRVIAFLLEPENRYIVGQNIEVGGGVNL